MTLQQGVQIEKFRKCKNYLLKFLKKFALWTGCELKEFLNFTSIPKGMIANVL